MMARAADLQVEGWAIAPPPIHQISKFGRLISHSINLGTQECNVTHTYIHTYIYVKAYLNSMRTQKITINS